MDSLILRTSSAIVSSAIVDFLVGDFDDDFLFVDEGGSNELQL
jgi:hypothetical protein